MIAKVTAAVEIDSGGQKDPGFSFRKADPWVRQYAFFE
jgi:hypothetical protein